MLMMSAYATYVEAVFTRSYMYGVAYMYGVHVSSCKHRLKWNALDIHILEKTEWVGRYPRALPKPNCKLLLLASFCVKVVIVGRMSRRKSPGRGISYTNYVSEVGYPSTGCPHHVRYFHDSSVSADTLVY